MLTPSLAVQDFFWDDILEFIDERKVIPIVGAELLGIPDAAGGEIPLQRMLAEKLAERLRVRLREDLATQTRTPADGLPEPQK